jgi:hypothetical protein
MNGPSDPVNLYEDGYILNWEATFLLPPAGQRSAVAPKSIYDVDQLVSTLAPAKDSEDRPEL